MEPGKGPRRWGVRAKRALGPNQEHEGLTRAKRAEGARSVPKARSAEGALVRAKRALEPQQEHGGPLKHSRAPGGAASCLFVCLSANIGPDGGHFFSTFAILHS